MIGLNIAGMTDKIVRDPPFKLRAWLKAKNISQAELSRMTGLNEGYISQLKSGQRGNPSTDVRRAIAQALNIPEGSLFQAPPSPEVLARLSPAHIEALGTLMELFPGPDSPSPPRGRKTPPRRS